SILSKKKNPKIKLFIRDLYQLLFDLLPKKKEFSINPIEIKEGYFFGFHDVQPFSKNNDKVLANKLYIDLKMPSKEDYLDVGFFKIKEGKLEEYVKIDQTNSWNYHKGCRLQWVDQSHLIFNCTIKNEMVSKIINIESGEEKVISMPIDSVSSDGRYATSFSYHRLEKFMPGYGYCYEDDISFINEQSPDNSGLYLIDLQTKKNRLLVDLKTLANESILDDYSTISSHYVTHSLFSKDGRYISFFHRWVGKETLKRYTRLMIFDLQTSSLFQLPIGYMVSHYVWNDKNQIIAYCNYKGVDGHALLDVTNAANNKVVAYPTLNSDGHQSFIDSNKFITDTYGDKYRMSKLYLVDSERDTVKPLASVYSPNKFQTKVAHRHIACDLHPVVSENGEYVCFDTAKTGKRALAIMSLKSS
ncbi:hypothetical protein, partial [Pseudopedobacter sp.]|uniref:hypothetical protein n=1 Tax=Pseudopedobacter sp. TaxID=1936787 RepID=UPI003340E89B